MNNVAIVRERDSISQFKTDVDSLLAKRSYFIERILPNLSAGSDFYLIKGKKSLGKAGAEKLASIYQLVATFEKDKETIESFRIEGLAAYICTLTRNGIVSGQGRGAAVLKNNGNDPNKTVKMAQKSAFIDSVIRSTGLSDIFTQDLETMPESAIQSHTAIVERPQYTDEMSNADDHYQSYERVKSEEGGGAEGGYEDPHAMTDKQRNFLMSLIAERISGKEQTEEWLSRLDSGLSISDASELISSLIPAR